MPSIAPKSTENPFLKAALFYVRTLLWPTHPLKPDAKEPLTPHGHQDATLDEQQIQTWWKKYPKANIGIPTGVRFWVLDVDPRNGGDETLQHLIHRHGALPDTIQQMTGGGGRHFLFDCPETFTPKCGHLGEGLDVKGEGGYIVVAPSIHPSGNMYTWDGLEPIHKQKLLPAPAWLLEEIERAQKKTQSEPVRVEERIPHGRQEKTLFRYGCSMRAKGHSEAEIFAVLWQANQDRCEKPGPEKDIRKLAASICKYPPGSQHANSPSWITNAPQPERKRPEPPQVLTYKELKEVTAPTQEHIFDGFPIPAFGATLLVGAAKSGKTVLAAQGALALARGKPLFEWYSLKQQGAAMFVEKDDPITGTANVRDIVQRSGGGLDDMPFFTVPAVNYILGPALLDWLGQEITKRQVRMVVLDSYTALRGPRTPGCDIVKVEQQEFRDIDILGKQTKSAIIVIHHDSRAGATRDWTQSAAGTFAVEMATEGLIRVERFADLDGGAPERLVRIRSRHGKDVYAVLRFREETLDHEFVLEGGAAVFYPAMRQIKAELPETFTPKDLSHLVGSRATAHRIIARLRFADALDKVNFGEYRLSLKVRL
jgi:hypothetical protein